MTFGVLCFYLLFPGKKSQASVPAKTLVTEELKKDSGEILEEGHEEGEIVENIAVDAGATGDNLDIASPKSSGICKQFII